MNTCVKKWLSLAQIQQQMQTALIKPGEDNNISSLVANIKNSPRLSAKAHLAIYQRSYIMRLQQCMAAQFSALKHALGDELFQLFVTEYVKTYPSASYTLNDLGQHFAQFLEETRPDAVLPVREDWPDFMIELADFEFSLNQLFDATADERQIPATEATEDEQLRLLPVFKLFQHQFEIAQYYRSYNNDDNPELPFPQQSFSLVVRQNYQLGLFDLNPAQYQFLTLMQTEQLVDNTKQAMVSLYGYDKAELDNVWLLWRKKWIASGFFVIIGKKKGTGK